jgi:hypothetical protein
MISFTFGEVHQTLDNEKNCHQTILRTGKLIISFPPHPRSLISHYMPN